MKLAALNYYIESGIAAISNNLFKVDGVDTFDVETSDWPILSQTHNYFVRVPQKVREIEEQGYDKLALPTILIMPNLNPDKYEMDIIPVVNDIYKYNNYEEMSLMGKITHYFINKNLEGCDRAIAISKQTKEDLEKNFEFDRIDIVRPGIDTDHFYPDEQEPEEISLPEKYMVYIGSFSPRKNASFLIDVLENLPSDFKLVIAGKNWNGDRVDRLKEKAKEREVRKQLEMKGYLSFKDLRRTYSNAEVYLHPAKDGGMELTPLEAAACGTPVVMNPKRIPAAEQLDQEAEFYYEFDSAKVADLVLDSVGKDVDFDPITIDEAGKNLLNSLKD